MKLTTLIDKFVKNPWVRLIVILVEISSAIELFYYLESPSISKIALKIMFILFIIASALIILIFWKKFLLIFKWTIKWVIRFFRGIMICNIILIYWDATNTLNHAIPALTATVQNIIPLQIKGLAMLIIFYEINLLSFLNNTFFKKMPSFINRVTI
jgi:hypothetical protein